MAFHSLQHQWGVWACWKDHLCLQKLVNAVDGDYMCFVYNELEEAWYPWGIKRDVQQDTWRFGELTFTLGLGIRAGQTQVK